MPESCRASTDIKANERARHKRDEFLVGAPVEFTCAKDAVYGWSMPESCRASTDIKTYNFLLHGLGRAKRIDEMLKSFSDMSSLGITPNAATYAYCINAALDQNDLSTALKILFHQNSEKSTSLSGEKEPPTLDSITLHTLLVACARQGRLMHACSVVKAYGSHLMQTKRTRYLFKVLFKAAWSRLKEREVLEAFEKVTPNIVQDIEFQLSILEHSARLGDLSRTLALGEFFLKRRDEGDVTTTTTNISDEEINEDEIDFKQNEVYHIMVEAAAIKGALVKAEELVARMEKEGLEPATDLFDLLIQGHVRKALRMPTTPGQSDKRTKHLAKALQFYDELCRKDLGPLPSTLSAIHTAHTLLGNTQLASDIMHQMKLAKHDHTTLKSDGSSIDDVLYNFFSGRSVVGRAGAGSGSGSGSGPQGVYLDDDWYADEHSDEDDFDDFDEDDFDDDRHKPIGTGSGVRRR
eukprot:CAMPEP_0184671418 /NCGR_PEP_ID=MMETSP0308-20130426/85489_1 /TAXON_ID=38269 /ORGANISM="Gloeochaete witrockiana, Strain SAG 46.84" /LENGTH=464 /DNA_ID=CAMNT_0027118543 /DNA_START=236 /DNA_END=1630 /DNA_ORIENTATION=+